MKRYLYLFPLMALTAATFTLAACDENKTDDTATTEQTAPADTMAADNTVPGTMTMDTTAPAQATPAVMHAEGATAYATAEGATSGAVFLTLHNPQATADRLIGASTNVAIGVEIHETATDANGVMEMRKVDAIEIQPGQQVDLKPSSYHLMLTGLTAPLTAGNEFQVTLDFEIAPDVTVPVTVTSPVAATTTTTTPDASMSTTTTEPSNSTEPMPTGDSSSTTTADEMPSAETDGGTSMPDAEMTPAPSSDTTSVTPDTSATGGTATDPHSGH